MTSELIAYGDLSTDFQRVEQAMSYLQAHYPEQPTLAQVASSVGLSEYHFQRLFTHWVGISPKRFLQFLTKEHARELLDHSASVLEAAYQSGLSGPGRLHDLFVNCDAVTPGEYKLHGSGLQISYGFHPSPFGECMVALTERGICGLAFVQQGDRREVVQDLRRRWANADLREEPERTAPVVGRIFPLAYGHPVAPLHLYLNGTNFQIKVWEALLRVPAGALTTYQEIARGLGMPGAARAVGQAVGANPIAFIIPCHRVIRKLGVLGGYRWGTSRKMAMVGWELARAE
jgi:AraC family transcriptional regulator, regulatory protein of adaptative response / methylated-DNA-[protein]-cysteine methyltransferase